MEKKLNLRQIGKRIYNTDNPREAHRYLVFLARGLFHRGKMRELYDYFYADEIRRQILDTNPYLLEQATRAFFYHNSTMDERIKLIKEHYGFMVRRFKTEWAIDLSLNHEFVLWRHEEYDWRASLRFATGQRKEGLLSLIMYYNGRELYQIMFWLQKDKDGKDALFIGAIQGANTENATEIIKETTKLSHRYRTKNLVLYMLRAAARAMGVQKIYAVSNAGYYANNHVRSDRKLKTDFGVFWQETGGKPAADERFYELPIVEPRKDMEEVPTRKRAVYRRRFAFLDEIDDIIAGNMKKILKEAATDANTVG